MLTSVVVVPQLSEGYLHVTTWSRYTYSTENGTSWYSNGKRIYTTTEHKCTLGLITIYKEQVITRYICLLIISKLNFSQVYSSIRGSSFTLMITENKSGAFMMTLYINDAGTKPAYSTFDFRPRKWPPFFLHVIP